MTNYRRREVEAHGFPVRWLDAARAANADAFATRFSSPNHYGLNEATVSAIERLVIASTPVAHAWLRERFPDDGSVQIVFGKEDVCVVETADFLKYCLDLFAPARDDVMVLHNLNTIVLFYCHNDELEIGRRAE